MNIAIIGAGWLGKKLAKNLSNQNFHVKVSVRSDEKKLRLINEGFNAFKFLITDDKILLESDFLNNIDVAIVSLTPQPLPIFLKLIDLLITNHIKNVVVFSSTGIYNGCKNWVTEDSLLQIENSRVKLLKDIEDAFLKNSSINATILRLGGLIGNDRHPVKALAKKDFINDANEPVNMVYQETILNAMNLLLKKPLMNTIFNLTENAHPTKKDFYLNAANNYKIQLPQFINNEEPLNRKVSCKKIHNWIKT